MRFSHTIILWYDKVSFLTLFGLSNKCRSFRYFEVCCFRTNYIQYHHIVLKFASVNIVITRFFLIYCSYFYNLKLILNSFLCKSGKIKKPATSNYFSLIRVSNLFFLHPTTLPLHRRFPTQLIIRSFNLLTKNLLTVIQLKGVPLDTGHKLKVHKTLIRRLDLF